MRLRLLNSDSTTFGAGATSEIFFCTRGIFSILAGGTFNTTTATIKVCNSAGGTFTNLVVDDPAGTPETQTFSATEVASSAASAIKCYYGHGLYFQIVTDSTGSAPSVTFDVMGDHVHPVRTG